jgi:hypothetical protein
MSNSCHSKPPEGIQVRSVWLSVNLAAKAFLPILRAAEMVLIGLARGLGHFRFPVVPVCSGLRTLGNYIWQRAPNSSHYLKFV